MYQAWHSSQEFNQKVKQYHDKHARQPEVQEAKARLEQLKGEIISQMRKEDFECSRFVYKGSTYEGVKIMKSYDDCPEFDLDFVIKGGERLYAESSHHSSGWCELKLKSGPRNYPEILNGLEKDEKILPTKVMRSFYGALSRCSFIASYNVKLRYHGPAVQLDIHHSGTCKLWFQVDLAPTFYLEGPNALDRFSECFVAKSPDDESMYCMWYRSHSDEEKKFLDGAGGQRKVVLRILKVMRGRSSQLSGLQSYHMKMALFVVMSKFPLDEDWTTFKTGERLIDVLNYVHSCLETGHMPNYFNRSLNILKMKHEARTILVNLLGKFITNKTRMFTLLETGTLQSQHVHSLPEYSHEAVSSTTGIPRSLHQGTNTKQQKDQPSSTSWLGIFAGMTLAAGASYAAYKYFGSGDGDEDSDDDQNNARAKRNPRKH